MRHKKHGKILGRKMGPRNALMRGLAIHLITNEKMITTEAKAKALRPQIEKMVTKARVSDDKNLTARRLLLSTLDDRDATEKLLSEIAPRFLKRSGGYTRIIKLPARQGDGAKMAQIEFVEGPKKKEVKKPDGNDTNDAKDRKEPVKAEVKK